MARKKKEVVFESEFFTLAELTHSETAERLHIDNTPDDLNIECLNKLCADVLDPLRKAMGYPILITSGFRSPKLNQALRASWKSQHMVGFAADIRCHRAAETRLLPLKVLDEGIDFDQMIIYNLKKDETRPDGLVDFYVDFIHISTSFRNRNELLLCDSANGKKVFTPVNPQTFFDTWKYVLTL